MLEKLLQFILKLLPKPLKNLWDKYEPVWRYCYYGGWTTVLSFITNLIGVWGFEKLGFPLETHPIANGLNTTISWIICATFAFVVNKKYVFYSKTTEKNDLKQEMLKFYGARFVTFFLELGLKELPVIFNWGKAGVIAMIFISQVIILALNYIFSKLVVFKKGAAQQALPESDEPQKEA